MIEIFYEESATIQQDSSAKTKCVIYNLISKAILVLLAVWIIYVFTLMNIAFDDILLTVIFALLPVVTLGFLSLFFIRLRNKYSSEFDYTFVSGDVRVSKVIGEKKRKHIMRFSTSNIEMIGKVGSETYNKYKAMPSVEKLVFTINSKPSEGKEFYYIVINNPGKKLLVFECTDMLIINILKFSNKNIIEKDIK